MPKPLSEYARKRNFEVTSEPSDDSPTRSRSKALKFVIHKHDARNLHYDFRLELEGTLKSWAVPKGPSLDPKNKRLAVQVEDHPLGYARFEGRIPEGQYGAGDVIVWDQGIWQPHGDPRATYKDGKLKFTLVGEKLTGEWALVRTRLNGSGDKEQWLLIKEKDDIARPGDEYDIVEALPNSVISGKSVGAKRQPPRPSKSLSAKPKPTAPSSAIAAKINGKVIVAGVGISHPDRIVDNESGTQKIQVAQFYEAIADWILPHLKQRPVALLRCPEGISGEQFFQKHADQLAIPNIKQLVPGLDPGHAPLMEIDRVRALVGAAQMGTLEFHTWGATRDKIETPDRIVLDLDPDPALPWRSMLEATQMTLSVLDELGLQAFLKTSGGKGMHIIVPLARHADWDTVKAFAKAIAQFISKQLPERFTATMGPKNRVGKIFIDYLRNTRGGSTVSAYSARARPGLPVSVPISRDELSELKSAQQWTVGTIEQRLDGLKNDPWAGYKNRQRISHKMWVQLGVEEE
ncbi:DNA ligase D [Pseudomonas sp. CCI3.2]|uniref:DNA ligase D n=1 Tax=unclassified Pseudomonas TaxID=196821 RepID=UPI002AC976E1|nr:MULTISPECIES: DNA ligase D [unclassified Pseudomonas]MEB0079134.1 DNA ligase D [Pseudomonas sp. MH10out]MEB0102079.1 DNA ligase D [Pseudomonas sp. CCI3.2]MEB0132278.1 DNA ligase D [Pseudomonas sp. CCI2.4]MEB0160477.1 DNA ligase D [Pseudomonas sp. AH2 (2023)]MEB0168550.1 DNA ligase D [Pseudomonas sp. CCC4.4]